MNYTLLVVAVLMAAINFAQTCIMGKRNGWSNETIRGWFAVDAIFAVVIGGVILLNVK